MGTPPIAAANAMTALQENTYGKTGVRLSQVLRRGGRHEVIEISVDVLFEGDFAASFVAADNRNVLPTDTIKNTVYVVAHKHPIADIETFASDLAIHFLERLSQLETVNISIAQNAWTRIENFDAAFSLGGNEKRVATLTATRTQQKLLSGFDSLEVLKTSESAFDNFLRDELTTLPETRDRLLGTAMNSRWKLGTGPADYDEVYSQVRRVLLRTFASHKSESVQHTLNDMAKAVLNDVGEVEAIRLTMPNKHRLLFDLARFGLKNDNQIFVPTDDPSGFIQATLARPSSAL